MDGVGGADGVEALLVERAQDFGLGLQAHVADFVEEERAAVGALEGAALFGRACRRGAGDGAVAVAEEFGFDVVFGDGGAVEFDEDAVLAQRLSACMARPMSSLPVPDSPIDEDAAVGGGHELDLLAEGLDGDGVAGDGGAER